MLTQPRHVAVDANGVVYISESVDNRIRVISQTGVIGTLAIDATLRSADSDSSDGTRAECLDVSPSQTLLTLSLMSCSWRRPAGANESFRR
jgi:hypothetical protein